MRRVAFAMGVLATALALALTASSTAHAASGRLLVNGNLYSDPSGCYDSQNWPLRVDNRTDQTVVVFAQSGCRGSIIETVPPGGAVISEFGASVQVG